MGVVQFVHRGDFKHLERFLKGYSTEKLVSVLDRYGQEGVRALASATPVDSGISANSWSFEAGLDGDRGLFIEWTNSSVIKGGTPIVVLLFFGHGTRNGGYVRGQDFITPAIQPVMDRISDAVWQEVTR